MYYPLHVHTELGSVGDAILRIPDYIQKAKNYGLDRLAITDHGSLSAIYNFADECVKNDIVPVIGMEAYEVENADVKDKDHRYDYSHLILLAKNNEGLKNLMIIHNDAQSRGFYGKPRTDRKMLQKHGKGIIGLSACIAGSIGKGVRTRDFSRVVKRRNQ